MLHTPSMSISVGQWECSAKADKNTFVTFLRNINSGYIFLIPRTVCAIAFYYLHIEYMHVCASGIVFPSPKTRVLCWETSLNCPDCVYVCECALPCPGCTEHTQGQAPDNPQHCAGKQYIKWMDECLMLQLKVYALLLANVALLLFQVSDSN